MKTKWKRGSFKIDQNHQNPLLVRGIVLGGIFAIPVGASGVTHLPTGLRITPFARPLSLRQCRRVAETMISWPLDWHALTDDSSHTAQVDGKPLRDAIHAAIDACP